MKEEVREKLLSGEYFLREKDQGAKSHVWYKFCEVVKAADNSNTGFVSCRFCYAVYKHVSHSGTSSLTRHVCVGRQKRSLHQDKDPAMVCNIPARVKSEEPEPLTGDGQDTQILSMDITTFQSELKSVMATLLDVAVHEIMQSVQRNFLGASTQGKPTQRAHEKTVLDARRTQGEQRSRETALEWTAVDPTLQGDFRGTSGLTAAENGESSHRNGSDSIEGNSKSSFITVKNVEMIQLQIKEEPVDKVQNVEGEQELSSGCQHMKTNLKCEPEDLSNLTTQQITQPACLQLDDPLSMEGTSSSELPVPEGTEQQVNGSMDHSSALDGPRSINTPSAKHLLEMKGTSSPQMSACLMPAKTSACLMPSNSVEMFPSGRTRSSSKRPLSSATSIFPATRTSSKCLEAVDVSLTTTEDLQDQGWLILDTSTGQFCIQNEMVPRLDREEGDEQDDKCGQSVLDADKSVNDIEVPFGKCTQRINDNTQARAQRSSAVNQQKSNAKNLDPVPIVQLKQNRHVTLCNYPKRAKRRKVGEVTEVKSQ